jgi:hypothetical protein
MPDDGMTPEDWISRHQTTVLGTLVTAYPGSSLAADVLDADSSDTDLQQVESRIGSLTYTEVFSPNGTPSRATMTMADALEEQAEHLIAAALQ